VVNHKLGSRSQGNHKTGSHKSVNPKRVRVNSLGKVDNPDKVSSPARVDKRVKVNSPDKAAKVAGKLATVDRAAGQVKAEVKDHRKANPHRWQAEAVARDKERVAAATMSPTARRLKIRTAAPCPPITDMAAVARPPMNMFTRQVLWADKAAQR